MTIQGEWFDPDSDSFGLSFSMADLGLRHLCTLHTPPIVACAVVLSFLDVLPRDPDHQPGRDVWPDAGAACGLLRLRQMVSLSEQVGL